jgi:hypothetical protein
MRKLILAMAALAALALAPAAFAQSHQGGYLGLNPGGQVASQATGPAQPGSQQGGYLGQNPGAAQTPARTAGAASTESATGWCTASPEPSRCRARSAVEHDMCSKPDMTAERYAHCRFALDQMHGQ